MTGRIDSARSSAHLTASSRRARTDRIVETFRSHRAHSDCANAACLAASSAAEIRGSHATVISADRAIAVPSWLTEWLQSQLKIGQTRLPCLSTATLHLQIRDSSVEITDVTLRRDAANPSHVRHADRQIRHAFDIQSSFQTIS